jgi:hypothetical protein
MSVNYTQLRIVSRGPETRYNIGMRKLFSRLALKTLPFWQRWASLKPNSKQGPAATRDRRQVRGYFDVLGHPVMIVANPDGSEAALDYSTRNCPEVPVDWARAFGREIDIPMFDGLGLARSRKPAAPLVFVGAADAAVIITQKATLTRLADADPRWRRGFHCTLTEFRAMRHAVGELARQVIADSQASLRHPRVQTESERVGPRTRVLATGLGRTIVIDHDGGARSHVGRQWLPGIQFPADVVATMQEFIGIAEKRQHLRFVESCDQSVLDMCANLNHHVMERHGGIYEPDLPGFPRDGYHDHEIAASKIAATNAIARAARR